MREMNLLPPMRRRLLRSESVLISVSNIVRSLNVALLITTVIGALTSGGLWFLRITTAPTTEAQLTEAVKGYQTLHEKIDGQNRTLRYLEEMSEGRVVWSDALSEVLRSTLQGVSIETMDAALHLDAGVITKKIMRLSGTAINRSTLVSFEQRLGNTEIVKSVTSPRTNLLERENPVFSFELELNGITAAASAGEED